MREALPPEALDRVFRTARTYNGYSDTPVSEAQLRAIWDLLKMGPTSANQSPARIVWCVSQEAKDKLAGFAAAKNAPKIRQAPVTAIIGYDLEFHEKLPYLFPHTDARAWFAEPKLRAENAFRNGTLQGAYLIIAARALGLDTGPMSGFDNAKVDEAFFAGTPIRSNFIATLGYGDRSTIRDRLPRLAFEDANQIL
jgi:3-hydroxypropanoate dehydrogenase